LDLTLTYRKAAWEGAVTEAEGEGGGAAARRCRGSGRTKRRGRGEEDRGSGRGRGRSRQDGQKEVCGWEWEAVTEAARVQFQPF